MDLGHWNQRLTAHFEELRRARRDLGPGIPLFALEHGLASNEVHELSAAIRAHILGDPPGREHALAWTVYAAEIGYRYAGDEYWQTFEAETPGWIEHGNRGWIRDQFVAFHQRFAGAEPAGAWATQFSIICWPITHAILPRDLQQQLARILYEIRHSFSAELFESPPLLGQFIATRSWNASARFRNFVQESALVGQIVAALLLQGGQDAKTLLHPATLQRIGDDVDRERRGRAWLRGARRFAEERARIRGLTLGKPASTRIQRRDEARAEVVALGIEPRLVLRPTDGTGERWEVSIEIPDLSHLLLRFPGVRDVLADSRCTVAGAARRPLAGGRFLHGAQRIPLSRWPRSDELLLKFERSDPQLEYLLRAECLLRPGPSWLFRIASDGLAYESRGMRVRAGERYVLLSTARPVRADLARTINLGCDGAFGVLLALPPALTPEWEQALRQMKITQAKSIEVWPAGLAAVAWDGEGYGEWLASETPTLAVRSDHPIDELVVSMSDVDPSLSLDLSNAPPGEPVFIELPSLPVGMHRFSVTARAGKGAMAERIGDVDVVMRIREARPWSPGITPAGPLAVELEPTTPSLEQLWEGRVDVAVHGPEGREITCRIAMFARAGETALFERQLPPVTLPLPSDRWRQHFEKNIKGLKDAQHAYDDARACEIEFSADELGGFTIRCEREFTPLRWSIQRGSSGIIVRLHDDVGSSTPPRVERFSFERPAVAEKLQPHSEHLAPRAGGLHVATLGDLTASIVVPPIVRGLADLKCEPRIEVHERSREAVVRLLRNARLWGQAYRPGDLISAAHQRVVLRALTAQVSSLLGGSAWENAEASLVDGPDGLMELKRNVSLRREEAGIGAKLALDCEMLANTTPRTRAETVASLAQSFRVIPARSKARDTVESGPPRDATGGADDATWLAEFALRIASDPVNLEAWAGKHVDAGIEKLLKVPTLARAARFLVLAIEQKLTSSASAGDLYAGWRWSP